MIETCESGFPYGASRGGDLSAFLRQFFFEGVPSALYTTLIALLLLSTAERFSRTLLLTDEV